MSRARRHRRLSAGLAFGLLALAAELAGRSLTRRLDIGRHVGAPSYSGADYYPFLLAGVKVGVALMLAMLLWRFLKARSAARAGRRVLAALGKRPVRRVPRVRLQLSPRLWLASFTVTSLFYLVHTDVESISSGRWTLLAPWLHTSALPVFAVLSVFIALAWSAVSRWLAEYETYARATFARARRLAQAALAPAPRGRRDTGATPRRLFGRAFDCRPPPLFA